MKKKTKKNVQNSWFGLIKLRKINSWKDDRWKMISFRTAIWMRVVRTLYRLSTVIFSSFHKFPHRKSNFLLQPTIQNRPPTTHPCTRGSLCIICMCKGCCIDCELKEYCILKIRPVKMLTVRIFFRVPVLIGMEPWGNNGTQVQTRALLLAQTMEEIPPCANYPAVPKLPLHRDDDDTGWMPPPR